MQIVNLYRYTRTDGGVTVSTIMPDCEYTLRYRLIADDGKALTNGTKTAKCIDTDTFDGWEEIDSFETEEEQYKTALNILGVDTDEVSNNEN